MYGCELHGSPKDGCPILEAPEEMHLKLSVNCVRRVRWFAKLGFLYPQRPLVVSLASLKANSHVSAIDCVVERIYPLMYVEKFADGSKIYRNEKQEEAALNK